jgi:hypothetical protein
VDRDAHAGSVLQQRILSVVGKEWDVIPAKSARKQGRRPPRPRSRLSPILFRGLENCNFDQARQEILKAVLYGFYGLETLWEPKDTSIISAGSWGSTPGASSSHRSGSRASSRPTI